MPPLFFVFRASKWAEHFKKHGAILLVVGYYVTGLRHAAPFIAGATKMRVTKFMIVAYSGALAWILVIVIIGQKRFPPKQKTSNPA